MLNFVKCVLCICGDVHTISILYFMYVENNINFQMLHSQDMHIPCDPDAIHFLYKLGSICKYLLRKLVSVTHDKYWSAAFL